MLTRIHIAAILLPVSLWVFSSCETLIPPLPPDEDLLDGPADGLTPAQSATFARGDAAFNARIFTAETGLGPYFVATSCGSCHAGDGKGHPFTTLTRFGQTDGGGNYYLDRGGPQVQNRALPGFTPERVPEGTAFSRFTPPAVTGLGFLEAVPDSVLLALADPADSNGDGISGVPGWMTLPPFVLPRTGSVSQSGKYIGRFGKKAAAYDLFQQTVGAYSEDIGVTSAFLPINPVNPEDGVHPVPATAPEVAEEEINAVVFYLQTLKVPPRRAETDPEVVQGASLFSQIGCVGCHTPSMKTGPSPVAALANREIAPYTDMLLHDMGPELDDGYTEGGALSSEWRTPPLWGLGLSPNSQGGGFFLLHDGRAKSIAEAIILHGGEGAASRAAFQALDDAARRALIRFLESL